MARSSATPLAAAPARNFSRCLAIFALSFLPMAARRTSASPSVKPATAWAIFITWSW